MSTTYNTLLLLSLTVAPAQEIITVDNPQNKFCGISYDEARQFCHLEASKSLPCPNDDDDCPYNMPCWEIKESCTVSPTAGPSGSPITRRSDVSADHNFCGLGFDNLFGCAIHCPNGSPVECPPGQLCYFNTVCDARIEGVRLGDPTASPTTSSPTISRAPVEQTRPPVVGAQNFCGVTVSDAMANCTLARHCPTGNNNECPGDTFCWVNVEGCDVNLMPTMQPTISSKPTPHPSYAPTTLNPAYTAPPTPSPLDQDDIRNYFWCGTSWGDASERCYRRCMDGSHDECPGDEECFAQAACDGYNEPTPAPHDDGTTRSPDWTASPTDSPVDSGQPTGSPIEKDDMRNFFFCGTSWSDASDRCYKQCFSGFHVECPGDEECFNQADCKKGVIIPKTPKPTIAPSPAPFAGTRSPTVSPAPTISPTDPQPTGSPVQMPTSSPTISPTESPTTPFPTNRPTFAPCAGAPCPNVEHCRSNQGYCGAGLNYCNGKSVWMASCGTPTEPPTSGAPTTVWPSLIPSASIAPTRVQTDPPTGTPTKLADVVYYLNTYAPTGSTPIEPIEKPSPPGLHPAFVTSNDEKQTPTSTPTFENVDNRYYAADDPAGSFFCGTDWNHAITECPHRCPSGEAKQCPGKMSCYAFTSCFGVGMKDPPTKKPTWEPTKRPTPKPTSHPTTIRQGWAEQNAVQNDQNGDLQQQQQQIISETPTHKPVGYVTHKPVSTQRPTFPPTEDRCRGLPCDYSGECRSRLGFCGTGIVYCNSKSSWVPSCGGGGAMIQLQDGEEGEEEDSASPNTEPTVRPTTEWEVWVESQEGSAENATVATSDADNKDEDDDSSQRDVSNDVSSHGEDKEDSSTTAYSGFNPDSWGEWGDGKGQQASDDQDLRWWTVGRNSSTLTMPRRRTCYSLAAALISWALS